MHLSLKIISRKQTVIFTFHSQTFNGIFLRDLIEYVSLRKVEN